MYYTKRSIASLTLLIVVVTAVLGQGPTSNVAYGVVGSQFVVYQDANTKNGFLIFDVPPVDSRDSNNTSPYISTGKPISTPNTSPQLSRGAKRNLGAVHNNSLVVLNDDAHLSVLNDNDLKVLSLVWKDQPTGNLSFGFDRDSQLIHVNDSTLYVISNSSPEYNSFQVTTPSFVATPITISHQPWGIVQYGYDTEVQHLIAVGGNMSSSHLDIAFYDDKAKPVSRKVDGDIPPARTDFCLTWDAITKSFYLFGGINGGKELSDAYSLKYRSGVWRWTKLVVPSGFFPRSNTACGVLNNQLILWGGNGPTSDQAQVMALPLSSPASGGDGGAGVVDNKPIPGKAASSPSAPIGAIVGGVVGGVALVLIILGLVMFRRRKQQQRKAHHHSRGSPDDDEEVVESKSRSMAGQGVIPLVPSPFASDDNDLDQYNRSNNARTPRGSSTLGTGSTLYSMAHNSTNQPLMDSAMMPAVSSPEYLPHSLSPSPPLHPTVTNQPFNYYPYAQPSSPPHGGSPIYGQSMSQPLPPLPEAEIQSRPLTIAGSSGVVTPHQRFEPHGAPYLANTVAPPPIPPLDGRPPFPGDSSSAAVVGTNAPFAHIPSTAPTTMPPAEPEWDVLIPVVDEDDTSTHVAEGMTSTVGGLSASHREFKHELPDSDAEEEADAAAAAATGPSQPKASGNAGRRASVVSVTSHAETEAGLGFLEPWVPPANEPPVPQVPQ